MGCCVKCGWRACSYYLAVFEWTVKMAIEDSWLVSIYGLRILHGITHYYKKTILNEVLLRHIRRQTGLEPKG